MLLRTVSLSNHTSLTKVYFNKFVANALQIKFGHSEKGSKFEKIFHIQFDVSQYRQILSGRFFSKFVPFSEGPNFNIGSKKSASILRK